MRKKQKRMMQGIGIVAFLAILVVALLHFGGLLAVTSQRYTGSVGAGDSYCAPKAGYDFCSKDDGGADIHLQIRDITGSSIMGTPWTKGMAVKGFTARLSCTDCNNIAFDAGSGTTYCAEDGSCSGTVVGATTYYTEEEEAIGSVLNCMTAYSMKKVGLVGLGKSTASIKICPTTVVVVNCYQDTDCSSGNYCDKASSVITDWSCKIKPYCGDGKCGVGENCGNCVSDCKCNAAAEFCSASGVCSPFVCSVGQKKNLRCDSTLSYVIYDECNSLRSGWDAGKTGDTCGETTYCSLGACVANICTPGDIKNKICADSSTISWSECYQGYRWDTKKQSCSSTERCSGGSCVPKLIPITCPSGQHLEGTSCVANPITCQTGTHLEGTSCVADTITCPSGQHLEGSSCVADAITCQTGTHLEGTSCVADTITCPTGTHQSGNACVSDTIPEKSWWDNLIDWIKGIFSF